MITAKGTSRNKRIYCAIARYSTEKGYAPTVRELADLCGLSSTSQSSLAVRQLQEQGLITHSPKVARSIQIIAPWPDDPPAPQLWGFSCYGEHGHIDAVLMEWKTDRSTADGSGDRQIFRCPKCGGSAGIERTE